MSFPIASVVWKRVNLSGSNVEVVAGHYFKISGRKLARRMSVFLACGSLLGLWITSEWLRSKKDYEHAKSVTEGIAILEDYSLRRDFYDSNSRFPSESSGQSGSYYQIGKVGPPRCAPGTRSAILDKIQSWSEQVPSLDSHVETKLFWLHGQPKSGKSAIAQTLSERWHEAGLLGASYFFSESSFHSSESVRVIPTLAYQLQFSLGEKFRALLGKAIAMEPQILKRSTRAQVEALILTPLMEGLAPMPSRIHLPPFSWRQSPTKATSKLDRKFIVIDGLDEVLSPFAQSELISSIESLIANQDLPLHFFFTSRSKLPTQVHVDVGRTIGSLFTIVNLDDYGPYAVDVENHLRREFTELIKKTGASRWIDRDWPPPGLMDELVGCFGGNFELASRFTQFLRDLLRLEQLPSPLLNPTTNLTTETTARKTVTVFPSSPSRLINHHDIAPILLAKSWLKAYVFQGIAATNLLLWLPFSGSTSRAGKLRLGTHYKNPSAASTQHEHWISRGRVVRVPEDVTATHILEDDVIYESQSLKVVRGKVHGIDCFPSYHHDHKQAMQSPQNEITRVVTQLVSSPSPDQQQAAVLKYFTSDASFSHPICSVSSGPGSRDRILAIYQWYRVMSPKIDVEVNNVLFDRKSGAMVLDLSQVFHIRFSPFSPARSHFKTYLTLVEVDEKWYISRQEDYYDLQQFLNLIIPPFATLTQPALLAAGLATTVLAKSAQMLGVWAPKTSGGSTVNGNA